MGLTISRSGGDYQHTYSDGTVKGFMGSKMLVGMNTSFPQRFSQQHIFINMLKHTEPPQDINASPGTVDSDGYIDASTSGSFQILCMDSGFHRAGTWVITWDGTGDCTVPTAASQISEIDIGAAGYPTVNRREYTITGATGSVVYMGCTGAPTNIQFFNKDDETRLNAGNILTQQFIDAFSELYLIRMMQLNITNNNYIRDYSTNEKLPYTYCSWTYDRRAAVTQSENVGPGVPARAQAEAAVELDCELWINIPHQMTNSAVTAYITDIWNNLTAGWKSSHKIWIEYSNEVWQSGAAADYADQAGFVTYLDATVHEATCVPATTACSETSHGLSDGDQLICFCNYQNGDWPYARSGGRYAIVDDANTFRLSEDPSDITNITQANPGVVTAASHGFSNGNLVRIIDGGGMTELDGNDYTVANVTTDTFELSGINTSGFTAYSTGGSCAVDATEKGTAPTSEVTLLRYIRASDSSKTKNVNYAERAVAIWDLCEAVVGAGNMYRVGTGWANEGGGVSWANGVFAVDSFKSAYDYWSTAPYVSEYAYTTNFEDATTAQITTDFAAGFVPRATEENITAIGCGRIITYEGGPVGVGSTAGENTKVVEFRNSSDARVQMRNYMENLADAGTLLFTQYALADPSKDSGGSDWFAVMESLDDTSSPRYLGFIDYIDGAPKS